MCFLEKKKKIRKKLFVRKHATIVKKCFKHRGASLRLIWAHKMKMKKMLSGRLQVMVLRCWKAEKNVATELNFFFSTLSTFQHPKQLPHSEPIKLDPPPGALWYPPPGFRMGGGYFLYWGGGG